MAPKEAENETFKKSPSLSEATADEVPISADMAENFELKRPPQCPPETTPNGKRISGADGPDSESAQTADGDEEEEEEPEDPRDRELRERYMKKSFGQKFFLEIVVALHTLATMMHGVPMSYVFMQKSCRNELGYNESICKTIGRDIIDEVQAIASYYALVRDIVSTAPGAIAAVVIGQYMIRYGMKAPLLSALIGAAITCLCQLVTFSQMSLPLYLNVLAEIPGSITGGAILVSTAAYTNIGLRVPSNLRMFRFMVVGAFFGIPIIFAILIGGALYSAFGMVALEAICAVILLLPTYMVMFRFKDIDTPEEHAKDGWREAIWDTLVDSFTVAWSSIRKIRPEYGRPQLCSTLLIFLFGMTGLSFSSDMNFLYVFKVLGWPLEKYTTLQSIALGLTFVLVAPCIVIVKKFKLSDPFVIFIGSTFFVLKFLMTAAAGFNEIFYYIQLIIGFPFYVSLVSIRNHLTSLLVQDEMAIFLAIVSALEKAVPIASNSAAVGIYNATTGVFPGAVYVVFSSFYVIPALLALLCMRWTWLANRERKSSDSTKIHNDECSSSGPAAS